MHRVRRIISLMLAALLLVTFATPLTAQSNREYSAPEDFEGFDYLANRFYVHDSADLRETVTAADVAPEDFPPVMAIVMVMAFDSEEHATRAFGPYSELMAKSVSSELNDKATGEPVDALGDDALAFHSTDTSEDYLVDVTTLTVREGDVIYLALTMTANGTSDDLSREYMDYMLDREISDEEVIFIESGESTGGAFALFPTPDNDDLLGGMDIQSDQYLTASDD